MRKLLSTARHAQNSERSAACPGVTVAELAQEFDVSEITIPRDLAAPENAAPDAIQLTVSRTTHLL